MRTDHDYDAWRRARSTEAPPEGFVDAVMAALPARRARRSLRGLPLLRTAAGILALAAFTIRVLCVLALFLTR